MCLQLTPMEPIFHLLGNERKESTKEPSANVMVAKPNIYTSEEELLQICVTELWQLNIFQKNMFPDMLIRNTEVYDSMDL